MLKCNYLSPFVLLALFSAGLPATASTPDSADFLKWAPTPPMGWNSWDCYGAAVNEQQVRANADYMTAHLKQHGWKYVVVDIQWYEPEAKGWDYRKDAPLVMDGNGRLTPAVNRFPSAGDGAGFKPLADYVHGLGLKFGIHILRGIPKQAVNANVPILNSTAHASDIADKSSTCEWNGDMYGVDMTKPGGQAYYDSLLSMYASWGVDFIKVDDLSRPYRTLEIEGIRNAIDKCGRPIVFSTSPGATPLADAEHVSSHANMWRISDDFWDKWSLLKEQFQRCADWAPYCDGGHFPDADMLPIGAIMASKQGSHTHFTHDEQYTLLTLWSMARSPLIFGGNLPDTDDFTLSLITNDEVIAVDQRSTPGRQLFRHGDLIGWIADVPNSSDKYLALFNAGDAETASSDATAPVAVDLKEIGFAQGCKVRDLWKHADVGTFSGEFSPSIAFHGAGLYRVSGQ